MKEIEILVRVNDDIDKVKAVLKMEQINKMKRLSENLIFFYDIICIGCDNYV